MRHQTRRIMRFWLCSHEPKWVKMGGVTHTNDATSALFTQFSPFVPLSHACNVYIEYTFLKVATSRRTSVSTSLLMYQHVPKRIQTNSVTNYVELDGKYQPEI